MAVKKRPGVTVFDDALPLPSRRGVAVFVTLATWGLLIVTVPLYFVFVLYNLPDVFQIVSNLRGGGRTIRESDSTHGAESDPAD